MTEHISAEEALLQLSFIRMSCEVPNAAFKKRQLEAIEALKQFIDQNRWVPVSKVMDPDEARKVFRPQLERFLGIVGVEDLTAINNCSPEFKREEYDPMILFCFDGENDHILGTEIEASSAPSKQESE